MQNKPWERTCDFCDRKYSANAVEIPRLYISKKVNIDDLTAKDYIASPDYCDVCISYIIRLLEKRRKLNFKYSNYNTNYVISKIDKY